MKKIDKSPINLNEKSLFKFKPAVMNNTGLSTGDPTTTIVTTVSTIYPRFEKQ